MGTPMQIHRVRGKDLRDALKRAREKHGDEALVLSQEAQAGGGVVLSVTRAQRAAKTHAAAAKSHAAAAKAPTTATKAPTKAAPAATQTKTSARRRTARAETQTGKPPAGRRGGAPPAGVLEVRQRLQRSGCSEPFIDKVCELAVRELERGRHPIDSAAAVIGKQFKLATSPRNDKATRVLAMVGPTGVGKTAVLLKLAFQMVQSGRRVQVATFDTGRLGAAAALEPYADMLHIPLHTIGSGEKLTRKSLGMGRTDVVLLDTPGCSPTRAEDLALLRESLSQVGPKLDLQTYLVMSATTAPGALELAQRAFAPLRPAGCVVTKLDETRQPGPVLEHVLRADLPVAFLCDGPDLGRHLHRASAQVFGDLLLQGRLR